MWRPVCAVIIFMTENVPPRTDKLNTMTATLIISTYNWPDALTVCLDSVRNLSTLPLEVIVGDDGSRDDTRLVVERFRKDFPVPLRHIWQPDEGFCLAMIRNKCVAAAKGDYIIQIDGDLALHPSFVADHLREARQGYFLKGGRVKLGRDLTDNFCQRGKGRILTPFSRGIESKRANAFRWPLLADRLASRYRRNRDNVLGCNMSYFRSDFIAVNGYDESFEGWGGEDLDLSFRFRNLGLGKRYLKFCALAYHLWHPEASMQNSDRNHALARLHRSQCVVKAEKGVSQYIREGEQCDS